ncbi:hypothetical protein [Thermosulfurimonas sp. F29]|uniref:hypothetical protein n=1 Tax=Thermosulfurimonas sp. F29 TaxID=2867247 RepID=UPI001C84046B|nr:hypothetical protein [Thermosulfurimonas sp. F29]MBX6424126.1 hypothetical protein [Thermosulfurimonas sp. F29]
MAGKTISDLWPVLAVVRDHIVLRDLSVVGVLRLYPPPSNSRAEAEPACAERIVRLERSLEAPCRGGCLSFVSVTMFGGERELAERFLSLQNKANPLAEEKIRLLSARTVTRHFYAAIAFSPESGNGANGYRKALARLKRTIPTLREIFEKTGFETKPLDFEDLISFLYEQYNLSPFPTTLPDRLRRFSKALFFGDVELIDLLFRGDIALSEEGVLRCGPLRWKAWSLAAFPSEEVSAALFHDLFAELPVPGRAVVHLVFPPSQYEARRKLGNLRRYAQVANVLGVGFARDQNSAKERAIDELLSEILAEDGRLIETAYHVFTAAKTSETLRRRAEAVFTAHIERGLLLEEENRAAANAFLVWSFPGAARRVRARRLHARAAVALALAPMSGPFRGDRRAPHVLFETRWRTQAAYSPISESLSRWGVVVIAPSGKGKSFLVQNLLFHLRFLKDPPGIGAVDLATRPSYEAGAELFGGIHISISEDAGGLNPLEFAFPLPKPPERHLGFLTEVFFPAVLEGATAEDLFLLRKGLRLTYERFLSTEGTPRTFEEIPPERFDLPAEVFNGTRTWLEARLAALKRYAETRDDYWLGVAYLAHSLCVPTLSDLLRTLSTSAELAGTPEDRETLRRIRRMLEILISGPAGRLFDAPTVVSLPQGMQLRGTDFVVFHLGRLAGNPSLIRATFPVAHRFLREMLVVHPEDEEILSRIYDRETLLRRKSRKKVLVVDECHHLRGHQPLWRLIEIDYKQGRALGLAPITISQDIEDFSARVLNNASMRIVLSHTGVHGEMTEAGRNVARTLGFSEDTFEIFKSLRTAPGRYSEFLLLSEDLGNAVLKLEPTPSERYLCTTREREAEVRNAAVKTLAEKGFGRHEAIFRTVAAMSELYPEGLPDVPPSEIVDTIVRRALSSWKR